MKRVLIGMCILAMVGMVQAALVTNGDFEATPFDTGWTNSGGVATTGLTGSGTAVDLGSGDSLTQDFITSGSGLLDYQVDFIWSLAATDGTQRVRVRGDGNWPDIISLKMDAAGLHKYGSAAWYNAVPGTYSADTPYHIRIEVGNFDADADPEYILGVSTDGINYDSSVVMGSFHNSGTIPFETIRFEGGSGGAVVDEVTVVPEPTTLGLLGLGGLMAARKRRS